MDQSDTCSDLKADRDLGKKGFICIALATQEGEESLCLPVERRRLFSAAWQT